MKRKTLWLEIGIILAGVALLAAWTRRGAEKPVTTATPTPTAIAMDTQGLRSLGKNASGLEEYENLKDGTVLIRIPGGTLQEDWERANSSRTVTLQPYLMAKEPVTNAQFKHFISASGHTALRWGSDHDWRRGLQGPAVDQVPAVGMCERDIVAYCAWAGLRIPTEGEWVFAAQGPEGRNPSQSDGPRGEERNRQPHPVGANPQSESPFGCRDMTENVWQWVSDLPHQLPGDPSGLLHDGRPHLLAARGGGSNARDRSDLGGGSCGLAYRIELCTNAGFRCARSLSGLSRPAKASEDLGKSTPSVTVGGLAPGMTRTEIEKRLGKPLYAREDGTCSYRSLVAIRSLPVQDEYVTVSYRGWVAREVTANTVELGGTLVLHEGNTRRPGERDFRRWFGEPVESSSEASQDIYRCREGLLAVKQYASASPCFYLYLEGTRR